MNSLILQRVPAGDKRRHEDIRRAVHALEALSEDKAWKVTIEETKSQRTLSQNAKLWAVYTEILTRGGEPMRGWTKDDLHEFFLINHFGSEVRTLFGRKRLIALRRSSRLTKLEFADFLESIFRFMSEQGVVLQ